MRILRLKVAGDDVRKWQEFLSGQGFDPGPSDGHFGKKTEEATIAFQSANGLEPDGIAANETFAKAMTLGFKLLPDVEARQPSGKVKEIGSIGGVKIFKLTN